MEHPGAAEFQARRFDFIRTELDLCATFLDLATTTSEEENRERNFVNARKAHENAARFYGDGSGFNKAQQSELSTRLADLSARIEST